MFGRSGAVQAGSLSSGFVESANNRHGADKQFLFLCVVGGRDAIVAADVGFLSWLTSIRQVRRKPGNGVPIFRRPTRTQASFAPVISPVTEKKITPTVSIASA